jgi:hypothetical protein
MTWQQRKNAKRRQASVERVSAVLRDSARTANEVAQLTGIDFFGVSSCLVGMRWRREVLRTIPKPGKPAVWRLA